MSEVSTPPTALVVEDDEHIGLLLRFMLARSGYAVESVSDGRAAQAFIASRPPPAVVLLDVMLPHVDGLTLLAQLRAQPAWREVPVVMLTAKAQERDVARALEAGASDYVVKPFQPEALLARLRQLLGQDSGSSK